MIVINGVNCIFSCEICPFLRMKCVVNGYATKQQGVTFPSTRMLGEPMKGCVHFGWDVRVVVGSFMFESVSKIRD